MTWFKVDDKFWSHRKVMLATLESTGLWVRTGTWCAMHLTDGFISDEIMRMIVPVSAKQADRFAAELEEMGLWTRVDGGWQFHQWEQHQPSREKVEAEREASRERQERSRHKRRLATVTDLSHRDSQRDRRRESQRPDPTRPDPTIDTAPEGSAVSIAGAAAACPHGDPRCDGTRCALCRNAGGASK